MATLGRSWHRVSKARPDLRIRRLTAVDAQDRRIETPLRLEARDGVYGRKLA
jgi:hypothetical protein